MKEKAKKKQSMKKAEESIFIALFAGFSSGFFIPADLYIANVGEINIPALFVLLSLIPVSVLIFGAVFLLCFFTRGRLRYILTSAFLAVNLGAYIQASFLSINMNELNGSEYGGNAVKIILNAVFWAVLIFAVFTVHKKFGKIYEKAYAYIPIAVIIMEVSALAVSYVTVWTQAVVNEGGTNPLSSSKQYVCTTKDLNRYSSEENVIIIFTDAYDSFVFDSAAAECPEALEEFDGFTYYSNTVGMFSATIKAIPYITTGVPLTYDEMMGSCRDDRFFRNMYSRYETNIYGLEEVLHKDIMIKYADNYIEKKLTLRDLLSISGAFYKVAAYKSCPEAMRGLFMPGVDNFRINYSFSDKENHKAYSYDPLDFYENIPETLEITSDKCFKMIYTFGIHNPVNITADLQRAEDNSISREEQAIAVNKILGKYLSTLKKGGVYDNSEIFILADHGIPESSESMYPLLMHKPAGGTGEGITVSYAPISHADLFPTLLKLSGEDTGERTIFDIGEEEERERFYEEASVYVNGNIKVST